MNKTELLQELKTEFEKMKTEFGFNATYEELNALFFIEDMVLTAKYISPSFSRQISNRMIESSYSWINELYSLIQPPQMNFIVATEQKTLTQEEKNEIVKLIDQIMYLVRKNKRIGFQGADSKDQGPFIDEVYKFQSTVFKPAMSKFLGKFENVWSDELKKIIKEE